MRTLRTIIVVVLVLALFGGVVYGIYYLGFKKPAQEAAAAYAQANAQASAEAEAKAEQTAPTPAPTAEPTAEPAQEAAAVDQKEWVNFYGQDTKVKGQPIPVGSVVKAFTSTGVECGSFVVATSGSYGLLACYLEEGMTPGENIYFTIDGAAALTMGPDQSVWEMTDTVGRNVELLIPPDSEATVITATVQVTDTVELVHPEFFEGQSSGKEYKASYDVGVKPDQVGIAFGYAIDWGNRSLGGKSKKCGLVVLLPGWYEKLTLTDGRYEVYDLPSTDREFWIRDLWRIRNEEQNVHYGCTLKEMIVWESGKPAIVWSTTAKAPAPTVVAVTPKPNDTPVVRKRVASGKTGKANFVKGDEVYGWKIVLESGKTCEKGCYLPSAPSNGTVEDGVVNPWPEEVPKEKKDSPWKP